MAKYTEDDLREDLKTKEYEAGFYTDIEYEDFPVGLNEDIVRMISAKKNEPEWMTEWRLEAFRVWLKMEEPNWANVTYEKPDFQAIAIGLHVNRMLPLFQNRHHASEYSISSAMLLCPEDTVALDHRDAIRVKLQYPVKDEMIVHPEIISDTGTLAAEYHRDGSAQLPKGYFPADDPTQSPENRWRGHAHLLFANWINEIYQTTPFDFSGSVTADGSDRMTPDIPSRPKCG